MNDWPYISRHIWETRYRWGGEVSIADSWDRVARAVAAPEGSRMDEWARRFRQLLAGFRFLPGGRILAGAGTDRDCTLCNCFVMAAVPEDLEGIFDALKEGAQTLQMGGGIGYDFSALPPAGIESHAAGVIASGPVAVMRIWDAMSAAMLSSGARRGAMMATLRCDHPDITRFIDAKRDGAALRQFNLSVQVTDEFMQAVGSGAPWPLVFPAARAHPGAGAVVRRRWSGSSDPVDCAVVRTLPARELWESLLRAAYDCAEPGVLFVDQINRENNLRYAEYLTSTNPCGEVPLPPYGSCNLGSLNLTAYVIDPFMPGARLDSQALEDAARLAVRFLDNVIDVTAYPLASQAQSAKANRRIGLGITGLADALAMLGQRYDSWTGRGVAEDILRRICLAAYSASVELAGERGAFPAFDRTSFLASRFVKRLPASLQGEIARNGIRNSHILAIAPAGTISLLAGNVSSGIEPIFALRTRRHMLEADGQQTTHLIEDFAWRLWRTSHPGEPKPDALLGASDLAAMDHLEMQAALQPWVDGAISKTINVPADIPFSEFRDLFAAAFRRRLKGCTVFRPNPVSGAVLDEMAGPEFRCCGIEGGADHEAADADVAGSALLGYD